MEEDEPNGINDNAFNKEDDMCLSDTKINQENNQIREKECTDYDKEIKYPKTIAGHHPVTFPLIFMHCYMLFRENMSCFLL